MANTKTKKRDLENETVVVAAGNAFDGVTLYGPFSDANVAGDWAESQIKDDWVSVKVEKALEPADTVSTADGLDEFLNDATHAVCDMWQDRGGKEIPLDDKYKINDFLTAFFQYRK